MRAGRLIRENRQDAAFGPCVTCGHAVEQHHERGEVGVFPCDKCRCERYEKESR
jgi:hypothetical protein